MMMGSIAASTSMDQQYKLNNYDGGMLESVPTDTIASNV
jgi:hypothetical protein